ncbi:trypsin-1-like isoform X3 [Schistocerca nitens]|uniref:trypsin-1-like isoform X1 n=1 Tax=Schistocerca nitens TaxID=7011 RepID=UPI0021199DF6|nr:trypsin-1-like isoform X1 [Schistocerca nitens]XP_049803450.1 trypsin-1-like isoform X3 [Schistocerca nitens]
MLRQTVLVLALVACVLGSALPVRRLPHSGPSRRFALSRGRIYGGHDAARGEFPYQVSLQHVVLGLRYHNCGGSVLSSNAILTAGHCAVSIGSYIAVAGDHDLSSNEGSEQEVGVSDQIVHPDYPGGIASNDIAVFLLESSLSLGEYVQAISLPSAGSIPAGGSIAVLSGWGATEMADTPDILQTVDVSIIDYESCSQNIDDLNLGSNPLTETMVCSGPIDDGISVCSGDSGGPLAQNGEVIGVVSWGVDPCGYPGAPSVYTRVSAHLDFINQNAKRVISLV